MYRNPESRVTLSSLFQVFRIVGASHCGELAQQANRLRLCVVF